MYYVSFRLSGSITESSWGAFSIPYFANKTFNGRHVLTGMYKDIGVMIRADINQFEIYTPTAISGTALDFNGIVVIG